MDVPEIKMRLGGSQLSNISSVIAPIFQMAFEQQRQIQNNRVEVISDERHDIVSEIALARLLVKPESKRLLNGELSKLAMDVYQESLSAAIPRPEAVRRRSGGEASLNRHLARQSNEESPSAVASVEFLSNRAFLRK